MPKGDDSADTRQFAQWIIEQLAAQAAAGSYPDNAVTCGWAGGRKPANAVDAKNNAIMGAWAKDRITIDVLVDRRPARDH